MTKNNAVRHLTLEPPFIDANIQITGLRTLVHADWLSATKGLDTAL